MSKPTAPTAPTAPLRDDELTRLHQRIMELEQALEQHKQIEQTLRHQIAMLQEQTLLLNFAHDAILVRDLDGIVVFWNHKAEQLYGWSREEARGNAVHSLLQTQGSLPLTEIENSLVQTGQWSGELSQTNRHGTKLLVHSHWELQRHVWGRPAVVLETYHDITEHRQTEMQLRASEAELRALFARITDVIFVFDREGYYRSIAPTSPVLPYKLPDDLVGKRMHDVMPAQLADFFLTILRQALKANHAVQIEYPLLVGDQEFWFSGTVSPLSDDSVVWIARDITQHRRTEQEQVRLREQIIRMEVAMLAELATPLIPLTDQISVMPIIGMIDSQRAQGILSTLLEGLRNQRASVVIVDITGVPHMDSLVANTLIQAAQSAKVLNAQFILTGMRAEVAQTLVALGIDLGDVTVRSTLQGGIAYALEQVRG